MGLELYSKIEEYLDFNEEIYILHKEFMRYIILKELDNILDIGCGQGHFLQNLELNGKKYFGIDLSSEQIKVCKQKGLKNVACVNLDKITQKFDCATAIFDVVNYISRENLSKFLKNVSLVLNQGSYFIFDVNSLYGFEEVAQGCINIDLDDKFIAIDANFEEQELVTNITLFTKKNKFFVKQNDSIVQYYHKEELLKELLEKQNFKIENIKHFSLHGTQEADKLIFVCKKV